MVPTGVDGHRHGRASLGRSDTAGSVTNKLSGLVVSHSSAPRGLDNRHKDRCFLNATLQLLSSKLELDPAPASDHCCARKDCLADSLHCVLLSISAGPSSTPSLSDSALNAHVSKLHAQLTTQGPTSRPAGTGTGASISSTLSILTRLQCSHSRRTPIWLSRLLSHWTEKATCSSCGQVTSTSAHGPCIEIPALATGPDWHSWIESSEQRHCAKCSATRSTSIERAPCMTKSNTLTVLCPILADQRTLAKGPITPLPLPVHLTAVSKDSKPMSAWIQPHAIVFHEGPSVAEGHLSCSRKSHRPDVWYHADDEEVRPGAITQPSQSISPHVTSFEIRLLDRTVQMAPPKLTEDFIQPPTPPPHAFHVANPPGTGAPTAGTHHVGPQAFRPLASSPHAFSPHAFSPHAASPHAVWRNGMVYFAPPPSATHGPPVHWHQAAPYQAYIPVGLGRRPGMLSTTADLVRVSCLNAHCNVQKAMGPILSDAYFESFFSTEPKPGVHTKHTPKVVAVKSVVVLTEAFAPWSDGATQAAHVNLALRKRVHFLVNKDPRTRTAILASKDLDPQLAGSCRLPKGAKCSGDTGFAETIMVRLKTRPKPTIVFCCYLAPGHDQFARGVLGFIRHTLLAPHSKYRGFNAIIVGDFNAPHAVRPLLRDTERCCNSLARGTLSPREREVKQLLKDAKMLCTHVRAESGRAPVTRPMPVSSESMGHVLDLIAAAAPIAAQATFVRTFPVTDASDTTVSDHFAISCALPLGAPPAKPSAQHTTKPANRSACCKSPFNTRLLRDAVITRHTFTSAASEVDLAGLPPKDCVDALYECWTKARESKDREAGADPAIIEEANLAARTGHTGDVWSTLVPEEVETRFRDAKRASNNARVALRQALERHEPPETIAELRKHRDACQNAVCKRNRARDAAVKAMARANIAAMAKKDPRVVYDHIDALSPGTINSRSQPRHPDITVNGVVVEGDVAAQAIADKISIPTTTEAPPNPALAVLRECALALSKDYADPLNQGVDCPPDLIQKHSELLDSIPDAKPFSLAKARALNADFTALEIQEAARALQTGKAGGGPPTDRSTTTHVKKILIPSIPKGTPDHVSDRISNHALEACALIAALFTSILRSGSTPSTWHVERVIAVPKTQPASSNPAKWRPICCASSLEKLWQTATLARLRACAEHHIPVEQTAYQSCRHVIEIPYVIQTASVLAKHLKRPIAIVQMDLVKAFDTCSFDQMITQLVAAGVMGDMLTVLYHELTNCSMYLEHNGGTSKTWRNVRGTKQGDPRSTLLFNLASAPILRAVNRSVAIERFSWSPFVHDPGGIPRTHSLNIMSYADDIFAVCPSYEATLATIDAIANAASAAGFGVSADKTAVTWWTLDGAMRAPSLIDVGGSKLTMRVNTTVRILGVDLDPPEPGNKAIPSTARSHRARKHGHAKGKLSAASKVWGTLAFPNSIERALFHCSPRSPLGFGRILSGITAWNGEFKIFHTSCLRITGTDRSCNVDSLAAMLEAGILPPGLQTLLEIADWYEAARNAPVESPWHQAFVAEVLYTEAQDGAHTVTLFSDSRVLARTLQCTRAISMWATYVKACTLLGLVEVLNLADSPRPAFLPREAPEPPEKLPAVRDLCMQAFAALWRRGYFAPEVFSAVGDIKSITRYFRFTPALPMASAWPRSEASASVRHALFALRLSALKLEEHNLRQRLSVVTCGHEACGPRVGERTGAPLTHRHLICECVGTRVARATLRRALQSTCDSTDVSPQLSALSLAQTKARIEGGISEAGDLVIPPSHARLHDAFLDAWHLWLVGSPPSEGDPEAFLPSNHGAGTVLSDKLRKCLGHFAVSVVSVVKPFAFA